MSYDWPWGDFVGDDPGGGPALVRINGHGAALAECECCEINDYQPAPSDVHPISGPCLNCGHGPDEHNLDHCVG